MSPWRLKRVASWFVAVLTGATMAGCGSPNQTASNQRIKGVYNEETNRLEELMYDSNANGKVDTWSRMDGTRVLWIEIDRNEDGIIDRWEYYGPDQKLLKVGYATANDGNVNAWAYRDADGAMTRVEFATAGDGKVNRTEFLDNGAVVRVEEDSNKDGRVDKWETYRGASLATVAYDTRYRGTPDRRLVYGMGGKLEAIETDPEGDGSFAPVSLKQTR